MTALESPRAIIATLARHFALDAVESGGRIAFRPHPHRPAASITEGELVAPGSASGASSASEVLERSRGQETELAQAPKWTIVRADEKYDTATVEARRITVGADRVASEQFQLAGAPEEAERRARRALMVAWVGRETLTCRLPPSRLALEPGDAIELAGPGSASGEGEVPTEYRITSVAQTEARTIEAMRHDPAMHELPPGGPRVMRVAAPTRFGAPLVHLMDLPQINEAVPATAPYAAVYAAPWYGRTAVRRSASGAGFRRNATVERPARMGTLAAPLPAGPLWRLDHAAELIVALRAGTLTSVTDLELFDRANVLAVESAPGAREIVQAGTAELIAPERYRLTRLLRGQRGSGAEMGDPAPAGAAVVVLGSAVAPLDVAESEIGRARRVQIDADLAELLKSHPDAALIQSLPGMGPCSRRSSSPASGRSRASPAPTPSPRASPPSSDSPASLAPSAAPQAATAPSSASSFNPLSLRSPSPRAALSTTASAPRANVTTKPSSLSRGAV